MPYKTMLGVAACLVILCQLVAMALVVNGQVRKAEARDAGLDSRRVAMAQCNESNSAAARQACVQQATAAFIQPHDSSAGSRVQALVDSTPFNGASLSIGKAQGLMPASFAIRQ